jgi:hypothetical protein
VTGLVPDIVRDAMQSESVFSASESFGVVTLVVLVVLLLEREVLRITGAAPARITTLSAVIAPLFVTVMLTIVARLVQIIP